jgi:hypothetical protein
MKSLCLLPCLILHSSDQNLRDVLALFIQEGFLPSDVFHRSPVVVYLRQQFFVDQLETPLHSLGLGSSGARLQLRFDRNSIPFSESVGAGSSGKPDQTSLADSTPAPPIETSSPNPLSTSSLEPQTSQLEPHLTQRATDTAPIEQLPSPLVIPTVEALREVCHRMVHSNFDCVSIPAVVTITKYLDNLIRHPSDHRYRAINLLNAAFLESVGAAKGALEILHAMGFLPRLPHYLQPTALLSGSAQSSPSSKIFFQFEKISEEETGVGAALIPMARLLELREKVFGELMNELEIPLEKRPVPATPPSQRPSPAPGPPAIAFDPYKPFIFRMSNQVPPDHRTVSHPPSWSSSREP